MARNISSNALAKLATDYGTKPINILEVSWNEGTALRYADKDITGIQGKIIAISNLDEVINIQQSGSSVSITVTLDDTDDSIRTLMNSFDIHKRPCTLYQHFVGLDLTDAFPIFTGYIVSPIVWSEGQRTLTFDILSKIHSREVGFSPEQGQFPGIPPELVGKVWPLCFGSPIHVPATRANQTLTGATVTLFGLPDQTLDAKRKLIQIGIQSLKNTYAFYNALIEKAMNLVDTPRELQDQYVDLIISEDQKKQEREDLREVIQNLDKQVSELLSQLDDLNGTLTSAQEADKLEIENKLLMVKGSRDLYLATYENLTADLNDIDIDKQVMERDYKYSRYSFNVVGKLRKKIATLLKDYYELTDKLKVLDIIKQDQAVLISQSVVVTNGYRFPQNELVNIEIDNQYYTGTFSGNTFTFGAAIPTYTDVSIATKRDTELNTFYINDTTLKLAGKYALLPNGYIIKITSQDATKCTFELRTKPEEKLRLKKRDISGTGKNIEEAKSGLNSLLTGQETDAEIVQIMNQMPKDLSPSVWERLAGRDYNTQIIELKGATGGFFRLYSDEFESVQIPYDTKASLMKQIIFGFPNVYQLNRNGKLEPDDILEVTGGPLPDTPIEVKFKVLPMPQMRAESSELTGEAKVQQLRIVEANPTQASYFTVIAIYKDPQTNETETEISKKIPSNSTASEIKAILEKMKLYKPGDLEVTGGPLNEESVLITYVNREVEPIDAPSFLKYKNEEGDIVDAEGHVILTPAAIVATAPAAVCYVKTADEGAHEHTVGEIEKLIENVLKKSQYKKPLEAIKKKLITLFNDPDKHTDIIADDTATHDEIIKDIKIYRQLLKSVQIPQTSLAEAYRLISDHEYEVLINFEILNYMQWRRSITPIQSTIPDDNERYYVTGFDINQIREVSGAILPQWIPQLINSNDPETIVDQVQALPSTQAIISQIGSKVTLAGNYQETYIANILPSTVHSVYAYRSIDGVKQLFPVPSRYYAKNENLSLGTLNVTAISLVRPLSEFGGENWEDGIFVTLTSSVGPNTADIIKWIAQSFTTLTIDDDSFDEVAALIDNYPSHFALFDLKDAIQLMQDIAFQARCAIWVKFNKLYIKYLSAEPDAIDTISEDDIDFGQLQLMTTDTENLVTKFTATWKPSYDKEDFKVVLRSNITKYDVVAEDFNFFIYNIYDLVLKSATFWLIRKASIWKRVKFTVPIHKLHLETFDTITLSLENNLICTGDVKALIEKADYDSESKTITMECWLPIQFGQMTPSPFAWPAGLSATTIFPSNDIILSGNAGNPVGDKVPTGLPFDPLQQSLLAIRPPDYGDITPSDAGDSMPTNPANDLGELDYVKVLTQDFVLLPPKALSDQTANNTNEADHVDNFGAQPKDSMQYKSFKQANESEYTFTDMCTVESFDHATTVSGVAVKGGSKTVNIVRQYYNVVLQSNGRRVIAQQMQIHKDGRIPPGTVTLVIYNKAMSEYQMQVPVMLNE